MANYTDNRNNSESRNDIDMNNTKSSAKNSAKNSAKSGSSAKSSKNARSGSEDCKY